MDFSKLRTGEITASLGGVALFIFLFFDWISVDSAEGISGWVYLGEDATGFVVFLAATIGIPLALRAAGGRREGLFGMPWGGATTLLGVLAFDIIVWRLFTVPDGLGLETGIFLGLIAAAGVAVGGYMTLQDGGVDPLGIGGAPSAAPRKKAAAKKAAAKRRAKPTAKRRAAR